MTKRSTSPKGADDMARLTEHINARLPSNIAVALTLVRCGVDGQEAEFATDLQFESLVAVLDHWRRGVAAQCPS